jgi:hypothetical protein
MCPTVLCGPQASSIKKSLASLLVLLGTYVPNIHAHVFMAPNIRAIMGMQDVWAGHAVNAYKVCRRAATVQRQHYRPLVWHRYSAKRLDNTVSHW